jgi:hypothetical protein
VVDLLGHDAATGGQDQVVVCDPRSVADLDQPSDGVHADGIAGNQLHSLAEQRSLTHPGAIASGRGEMTRGQNGERAGDAELGDAYMRCGMSLRRPSFLLVSLDTIDRDQS